MKLTGDKIILIPMDLTHSEELFKAIGREEVWEFTWRKILLLEDAVEMIEKALEEKKAGTQIPFVIYHQEKNKIVGTTRIGNINQIEKSAQVGWTWLSPEVWRTSVNRESKLLQLEYCFTYLNIEKINTDISSKNKRSMSAIEKIGFKKIKTDKNYRLSSDGTYHDKVEYQLHKKDWEKAKEQINKLLEQYK